MLGPDPTVVYPLKTTKQVVFLKNIIKSDNIEVGDYTYIDDPDGHCHFEQNVLYHYPFIGDKLIIGKFCAIAHQVKFIMNGANHKTDGFSTFPFYIFENGWEVSTPQEGELPYKGDTVIGHDVWIGYNTMIMPGVTIGNGAIIASNSVVTSDVPAYSVVGGNPAQVIKQRFESSVIDTLERIAWWEWEPQKITQNLNAIVNNDIKVLLSTD